MGYLKDKTLSELTDIMSRNSVNLAQVSAGMDYLAAVAETQLSSGRWQKFVVTASIEECADTSLEEELARKALKVASGLKELVY